MAKTTKTQYDWQKQQWETTSTSAFPPIWKPEKKDEEVIFKPEVVREIELKKGKKSQKNYLLDCKLVHTNSDRFFTGSSKNQAKMTLAKGEMFCIPLSATLHGEFALAVEDKNKTVLSPLAQAAQADNAQLRVIYKETVPIGGGQKVKRFLVQAPAGLKEKLLSKRVK